MRMINLKLLREFAGMRAQVLSISFIIIGGISTFVMALSLLDSLQQTRDEYYRQYRYADIFASLKRAPETLRTRLAAIKGVRQVETRVSAPVSMKITGFDEPVSGLVMSVPDHGQPRVNSLHLRAGRLTDSRKDNEVVVSSALAAAHKLKPGSTIQVTIHGKRRRLTVVGTAMSPEFVYQVKPGASFPDNKRYGILWMSRSALASAYDMKGAFNNAVFLLERNVRPEPVIDQIDEILDRHGGLGAYARKDHLSDRFLDSEMSELKTMATVFPVFFLALTVFILNIYITRITTMQRELIAGMKAFGYSNRELALHYIRLMLMIATIGAIGGIGLGTWFGQGLAAVYQDFFHFPFLEFRLQSYIIILALASTWAAALIGTLHAVRRATAIPPAEAMQPEPPARYSIGRLEKLLARYGISPVTRMIFRHIGRNPMKSVFTVIGIAFACGIMMLSNFQRNAINYMVDFQFRITQGADMRVTYINPTPYHSLYSLRGLQGTHHAEPFRSVPVRLRHLNFSHRTGIEGLSNNGQLRKVLDLNMKRVHLPEAGILLSDHLAKTLRIKTGQTLTVEVLEGSRPVRQIPVVGIVKQQVGVSAYMEISALNRFMQEGRVVSGAYLTTDRNRTREILNQLRDMPQVAGTERRQNEIDNISHILDKMIVTFTTITMLLGIGVTFGVIYNSARIALSERGRELASMRVLGFTRGEIAWVLMGEFGFLVTVAIPLGFAFGYGFIRIIIAQMQTDLFRVPLALDASTYAFAALTVIAGMIFSVYMIWRRLRCLDLVGVLKTQE